MTPNEPQSPSVATNVLESRELIRRMTRRGLIAGSMAVGLLTLLPYSSRAAEGTPVASPVAEFPITVTHEMGETTIPSRPERIVAVSDFTDLDYLLALDVAPVLYGFTNAWESGAMPWQMAAAELASFDSTGDLDLESIAAARPDLIVAMPSVGEEYTLLSEIAPTVVLGWDTEWRDGLRLIARATGLQTRAEERIAEAEVELASASQTLAPLADKRLMVGFQYGDTFYIWGEETASGKLFTELGLNFIGGPDPGLTSASLEQVNLLEDADILLSVDSDPAGIETQEASPLFRGLPAVQSGGYGVLTVVQSRALGDGLSPLSIPWVMPQFIELIQNLASGNGKKLT